MVLRAVLGTALALISTNPAKAAEAAAPIQNRDPDVARLVALLNAPTLRDDLDGIRNITVHINRLGKAKSVIVKKGMKDQGNRGVEESIKRASFTENARGKRIQLVFSQPSPKAILARRTQ